MSLKDINFKLSYRSDNDDLLNDFYLPALSNSKEYCRAAGYFSTVLLNELGKGLYSFLKNDGKIRLVCGFQFSKEVLYEVREGYLEREQLEERMSNYLYQETINLQEYLTSALSNICWMIAHNRLEIKIAIKPSPGIYHEKVAIFQDNYNNAIATQGSANETEYGFVYNFEHFDVYKSWESDDQFLRIQEKIINFEKLWSNNTQKLLVVDFPLAARQNLITLAPNEPIIDEHSKIFTESIQTPLVKNADGLAPRPYQTDIINSWFNNNCKGIFEMATGTGKTYTSLFGVQEYLGKHVNTPYLLIVCCPFQHLVDQWAENVKDIFPNINAVKCYDSKKKWFNPLSNLVQNLIFGQQALGIVLTTTNTGSSDIFMNIVNTKKLRKIVICDEVHNIGSNQNKKFLQIESEACIGLSATPIRPYDEEGNKEIQHYFGISLEPKIGIKEAIQKGFLVQYNYFIYFCELDESEYDEYKQLSIRIVQQWSKKNVDQTRLQNLLLKRARIISSCSEKQIVLGEILNSIQIHNNLLVYTAEDPEFFKETLSRLCKHDIITLIITSEIDKSERGEIIKKLESKDIDCILAMRCLDEGVDIPSADKAIILASSTNEKQYIQRRGRVLRKDKEGLKRHANIYDVLVIPPDFVNEIDKGLFEREFRRVLEFASAARNGLQIIISLKEFAINNKLLKQFTNVFKEFKI